MIELRNEIFKYGRSMDDGSIRMLQSVQIVNDIETSFAFDLLCSLCILYGAYICYSKHPKVSSRHFCSLFVYLFVNLASDPRRMLEHARKHRHMRRSSKAARCRVGGLDEAQETRKMGKSCRRGQGYQVRRHSNCRLGPRKSLPFAAC